VNFANLIRKSSDEQGTFGEITFMDKKLYTLELPWKNNEPSMSCIPEGIYPVEWVLSNRWKRNVYQLKKTEPRIAIQIHPGNFAGDTTKDYQSNVEGCILLGHSVGELQNKAGHMQKAILDSKSAVAVFEQAMNHDEFTLTIQSAF
jgi:hypothetical protein